MHADPYELFEPERTAIPGESDVSAEALTARLARLAATGEGELRALVGEFRRSTVLVPVAADGGLPVLPEGGIRWLPVFTDETALRRFAAARGEHYPEHVASVDRLKAVAQPIVAKAQASRVWSIARSLGPATWRAPSCANRTSSMESWGRSWYSICRAMPARTLVPNTASPLACAERSASR